jgi:hypothetical protein
VSKKQRWQNARNGWVLEYLKRVNDREEVIGGTAIKHHFGKTTPD